MARPKNLNPERAPGICEGVPQSDSSEAMAASNQNHEEQVEEGDNNGGEKAKEIEGKEEGNIEGKDIKEVALKKPAGKRGRKKKQAAAAVVPLKREGKEVVVEEKDVNVEGSSDFVAEKERESGEKLEENGVEIANIGEDDGGGIKEEGADNGQGSSGQVVLRRRSLRELAQKRVSYAEVEVYDDEDEGFPKKRRRRRKAALKSQGEEDGNSTEKGGNNDIIPAAEKRGRVGRPKRKVSGGEDNEGEDVKKEKGKEDQEAGDGNKRRGRKAKKVGNKMDEGDLENGTNLEKQEGEDSLKGASRNAKKHVHWQLTKEERDKWIAEECLMCHQCQRNDKGRVVRCNLCKRKRYCIPCSTTWYCYCSIN